MRTTYISFGLTIFAVGIIAIFMLTNQSELASTSSFPLPPLASTTPTFKITSMDFVDGGRIPSKYTCDTKEPVPPELLISGAPEETKSFILIVEDPDIPEIIQQKNNLREFVHWVFYNIPGNTTVLRRGLTQGEYGITSANGTDYTPPCPPPQYNPREHRYVFTLYALNKTIDLGSTVSAPQLRKLLAPYLIAETRIVGRYSRR